MLAGVLVAGCHSRAGGGDDDDGGGDIIGEWYGDGTEFPDGDLCLIFCENGRFFSGDSACSETSRSDFEAYRPYELLGDVVLVEAASDCAMDCEDPNDCPDCDDFEIEIRSLEGDELMIAVQEGGLLPFRRVGDDSSLCTADLPAR